MHCLGCYSWLQTHQTRQGNTTPPTEMAHFLFFSKKMWAALGGIRTHITVSCSTHWGSSVVVDQIRQYKAKQVHVSLYPLINRANSNLACRRRGVTVIKPPNLQAKCIHVHDYISETHQTRQGNTTPTYTFALKHAVPLSSLTSALDTLWSKVEWEPGYGQWGPPAYLVGSFYNDQFSTVHRVLRFRVLWVHITWEHTLHMYMMKGLGIFLENCEKLVATQYWTRGLWLRPSVLYHLSFGYWVTASLHNSYVPSEFR